MNLCEYENVKNYSYLEYCNYLQKKYGLGLCDYMRPNWTKNPKVTRTKDGLYAHHKYENCAQRLSNPEDAKKNPYEWQLKENIIYCDFLEHLFLHILICENQPKNKKASDILGLVGIIKYIVPELNDVYSGWVSKQSWQNKCHNIIINDKDVYMLLIKRFKNFYNNNSHIVNSLLHSYNENYGLWSDRKNHKLYKEIKRL